MKILLRKKAPTRSNPAPPAALIFLLGCIFVTFSSHLRSDLTLLQAILAFAAVGFSSLLGSTNQWSDVPLISKSIVYVILCPLPYLLIAWSIRKHFVDWLTFFLISTLMGCATWSYYIHGQTHPIFIFLSICAYSIPVWFFVQTFGGHDADWWSDWLLSLLITVWSGFFLWSYLLTQGFDVL